MEKFDYDALTPEQKERVWRVVAVSLLIAILLI